MSIDFDRTANKEARNHAEMYRILNNVRDDKDYFRSYYHHVFKSGWIIGEAQTEVTILNTKGTPVGEADLILLAQDKQGNIEPLLVIEVKKRVLGSLTRPFQSSFKQAWKYAEPIGCRFCAVYDGHFFITMQSSSPYLVGMIEFSINSHQEDKDAFARNLWISLTGLKKKEASGPIEGLCGVLNYPRWKKTIRHLIRDAYRRAYDAVISDDDVEIIAKVWDMRNR